MVYSISYFALKDHTFPVRVIMRKVYPIARHPNGTFRRVESESEKKKVRLWKRKERMRKAPPGGCRAGPIPLHHPSNCPPPSLFLYIANSSPAVGRLLSAPHGRSGATGWPFRRNGIAVPAQRYHRSGATGWLFRRNGVAVPAQRSGRSGATVIPFRRNGIPAPARQGNRSYSLNLNKLRGRQRLP